MRLAALLTLMSCSFAAVRPTPRATSTGQVTGNTVTFPQVTCNTVALPVLDSVATGVALVGAAASTLKFADGYAEPCDPAHFCQQHSSTVTTGLLVAAGVLGASAAYGFAARSYCQQTLDAARVSNESHLDAALAGSRPTENRPPSANVEPAPLATPPR
jgi:hypothetical protein